MGMTGRGKGLSKAVAAWTLACGLVACTPDIPPPPDDGYVVIPRVVTGRLTGGLSFQDDLNSAQRDQILALLAKVRAVAGRQVSVEVAGGGLSELQKGALTSLVASRDPRAQVLFLSDKGNVPVVNVRYVEVVPRRCLGGDPFTPDSGLLPPGCAVALTFGRMVANPQDLIEGQTMGGAPLEPLVNDALRYGRGEKVGQESGGTTGASSPAGSGVNGPAR